jgi:hypothetical protein
MKEEIVLTPAKTIIRIGATAVLTLSVALSAAADWRPRPGTWNEVQGRIETQGPTFHENERVTFQGVITSVGPHVAGYRVHLDRSRYVFLIPESHARNIGRDLRVGVFISVSGVVRKGMIYVDRLDDERDHRRHERLYGVVESVDLARDLLWVRDRDSGRRVRVDADRLARRGRTDLEDLRRGDAVVLVGEWEGRDFEAWRMDLVRPGRR